MTITRAQVRANAESFSRAGTYFGYGQCLKFSRTCAAAPGGVYDANAAWADADYKHRMPTGGVAPAGTFVFWAGGSHGHVAVSDGLGRCWSTDYVRTGRVDLVQISAITLNWGFTLRGWTEDINGVHPLLNNMEFDEMATEAEIRDAVRDVVDTQIKQAITSDAFKNAVRLSIEAERAESAEANAQALLHMRLEDPTEPGTAKTVATYIRYAPSRVKRVLDAIKAQ